MWLEKSQMIIIGKVGNFTPLYKSFNFQTTGEKVEKALSSNAAVRQTEHASIVSVHNWDKC